MLSELDLKLLGWSQTSGFLNPAPPRTGSPFGPGTPEESEKSPETVPRAGPQKCRKSAPRSLKRVRKESESQDLDSFRTLLRLRGALFRHFWGPAPGYSFRTLFGLFRDSGPEGRPCVGQGQSQLWLSQSGASHQSKDSQKTPVTGQRNFLWVIRGCQASPERGDLWGRPVMSWKVLEASGEVWESSGKPLDSSQNPQPEMFRGSHRGTSGEGQKISGKCGGVSRSSGEVWLPPSDTPKFSKRCCGSLLERLCLSAPKSRDSLRLRRRFLPLPEKSATSRGPKMRNFLCEEDR